MKSFPRLLFVCLVLVGASVGNLSAQRLMGLPDNQKFSFIFDYSGSRSYEVISNMKIEMNMQVAGESATIEMNVELSYTVTLTPAGRVKEGVSTLHLEPSDIGGVWDISVPGAQTLVHLYGSSISGTQNGVLFIDTEKGIGLSQAREFTDELAGLYMSGEVDMDSAGRTIEIRGERKFFEFWKESNESQIGFFGIIFPPDSVAEGKTWTESISMKKMGDVVLNGELESDVTFTREPDTETGGRRLSVFSVSGPFSKKNVTGFMSQAGQRVTLDILALDRSYSGTFLFDRTNGNLIDSSAKIDAIASMKMAVQQQSVDLEMIMDVDMRLRYLD